MYLFFYDKESIKIKEVFQRNTVFLFSLNKVNIGV